MKNKLLKITFLSILSLSLALMRVTLADEVLAKKLAGRILLQVESRGEAWYINPDDNKKYYLGKPGNAFNLIKKLSLGISSRDLLKIPVSLIDYDGPDSDGDGLPDRLENILGTDNDKIDSDGDGFADKLEIANNFNPLGREKIVVDQAFADKQSGRIFLQVENKGALWYLNPTDKKRYYLGEADDVSKIISQFGLGIKNSSLNGILSDSLSIASQNPIVPPSSQPPTTPSMPLNQTSSAASALANAATAIRAGQIEKALTYFTPEIKNRVKYSLDNFNNESRLAFANLLSAAKESGGSESEKTFSTEVYFDLGGYKIKLNFLIKKQPDDSWLIANL